MGRIDPKDVDGMARTQEGRSDGQFVRSLVYLDADKVGVYQVFSELST